MGLFDKKKCGKILKAALGEYQKGNYEACKKYVEDAMQYHSGRAYFCNALLMLNDNVTSGADQDMDSFYHTLNDAASRHYPFSYGVLAYAYDYQSNDEAIIQFLRKKIHTKDAMTQYFISHLYMGYYDKGEKYKNHKISVNAAKKCILYAKKLLRRLKRKKTDCVEFQTYNSMGIDFDAENILGRGYYILARAQFMFDEFYTRPDFVANVNEAKKHLKSKADRFYLLRMYLIAIFYDLFGLKDISLANAGMKEINELFEQMDNDEKRRFKELYNDLWNDYHKFYQEETERLRTRSVHFTTEIDDRNDLSLGEVMNALSEWGERVSHSTTVTTESYTIGDHSYSRGEQGYLYDESGLKSGYRIDDYGRLYDENGRELGYFNMHGLFIDN